MHQAGAYISTESLIDVGRLREGQRHDAEAIGAAVLDLFKMALEEICDVWPGARVYGFSGDPKH